MAITDRDLLDRFLDTNDESAFAHLLERHQHLVWNVCHRILVDHSRAEDAFQATFLTLLKHGSRVRKDNFGTWLHRVATHNALRMRKMDSDFASHCNNIDDHDNRTSSGISVFEQIERAETYGTISEEISQLPSSYSDVIVLYHLEKHTRQQTADLLGTTVAGVKARLERGRKLLRDRLLRRGISLGFAAGVLTSVIEADAAIEQISKSTLTKLIDWRNGKPLDIDIEQNSDFFAKESIMQLFNQQASTAKWAIAFGLALVAVIGIWRIDVHAGGDGPGNNDGQSEAQTLRLSNGQPSQSASSPSDRIQPWLAVNTLQEDPGTALSGSAAPSRTGQRHLKDGNWTKKTPFGTMTVSIEQNRIIFRGKGAGELAPWQPEARAEYTFASDGTIYGLIHNIDLGLQASVVGSDAGDLAELAALTFNDIPFTIKAYVEGDVFVLKQLQLAFSHEQLQHENKAEVIEAFWQATSMISGVYQNVGNGEH